ncbi:transcription initiation factor TFIID subunit 4-like [Mizuhopecten yessoensis]|uniref:transcription initiation factor TFIID subunit 4-like n=1 Tax=Mizuhopecten yessoensis TaxID=6573 RepID=UPI000B45C846|nr:transcription initiation factor TFIID subunit 4-like [Mizuhopecten yessoensis]
MATANFIDDLITSEIDESAVSALVGALEGQLASPTHKDNSQSISESSINNNHITTASTPVACTASSFNIVQTNVTQGLKGLSLPNSVTVNSVTSPLVKLTQSDPQIIGINSIINSNNVAASNNNTQNNRESPASNSSRVVNNQHAVRIIPNTQPHVNSRSSPLPQAIVNSNSLVHTNHIPSANSPLIDLNRTTHSPNVNTRIVISKPGETVVDQKSVIIPQVTSSAGGITIPQQYSSHQDVVLKPGHIILKHDNVNSGNVNAVKQERVTALKQEGSMNTQQHSQFLIKNEQHTTRSPISNVKHEGCPTIQTIQTVHGTQHIQTGSVPSAAGSQITQATNVHIVNAPIKGGVAGNPSVITVRTPGQAQPGQVVMRQQTPHSSGVPMHVVSVSGSNVVPRFTNSKGAVARVATASPARQQQINIAPRPGTTAGTITLPQGMLPHGGMLMKNEQGQFVIVTANQGGVQQAVSTTMASSTTGHRIQYVRPPTTVQAHARPPTTQIVTIQHPSGTPIAGQHQTVLRQTVPSSGAPALVSTASSQVVQTVRATNPSMAPHTSTAPGTTQSSGQVQQQPLDNVKKCKNFLSTLLKLAAGQPKETVKNVRELIQGLIDGKVEPEAFTERLQAELKSSPQPYLVPFLKKSLPLLRRSLIQNKMSIEGVRAPPVSVLQQNVMPTAATSVGQTQNQIPHLLHTAKSQQGMIQVQHIQKGVAHQRGSLPKTVVTMAGRSQVAHHGVQGLPTVSTIQGQTKTHGSTAGHREKPKYDSLKDDDDINDVATMGGVNLSEESKNILATNADFIGTQIRSCKDEAFLHHATLQSRISAIAKKHGVDEVSSDVINLVSHAAQERMRDVLEKLATIAEHRIEIYKMNDRFELTKDGKSQLKFIEELDKLEKKRHEEQEWEKIMKAAKSRSKHEDPEQQKIKQKAKELQQAEIERLRQEEANLTALAAIGPRKKRKTDFGESSQGSSGGSNLSNGLGSSSSRSTSRPRIKRVTLRDVLFFMEQERSMCKSKVLYKTFLK